MGYSLWHHGPSTNSLKPLPERGVRAPQALGDSLWDKGALG